MPLKSMHQPVLSFSHKMLVLSSEGPLLSGLFMSNLISDSPQNQGIWDGLNANTPPVQLTRLKHPCQQIKSTKCQTCQVQIMFIINLGNSKKITVVARFHSFSKTRWPCHLPIEGIETRFFKPAKFVSNLSQIPKLSCKKSRLPRQQVTSAMVANLRWYNLEFQTSCLCSNQVRLFGKDKQPSARICIYKNIWTKPKRSLSFLHFVIIALLFPRDEQLQDWRGSI